jgi:hypothetical protein
LFVHQEEAIRTQRKARPKGTGDKDREFESLLRRAFLLLNGDAKVPDEELDQNTSRRQNSEVPTKNCQKTARSSPRS